MTFAATHGPIGNQQVALFGLPDSTAREQLGLLQNFTDPYWGTVQAIYGRANGSIRQGGLCVALPSLQTTAYRFDFTEVPNTANLGRAAYVAMTSMTSGQFGWFVVSGVVPVNCTSSIAADTAFGIVAAGQGGVVAAGKQVLGGRVVAPATTTVVKTNCTANSGSTILTVSNSDGWFCGAYLSGTGIAALTVVTDIDPSGKIITLSVATTAAVSGSVTATYNNATVYYNVVHVNNAQYQGPIT
jgi:hypothetical protein